jgi:hypothetical protein
VFESVTDSCPYCGEVVEVGVDPGGAVRQVYVQDCPVCCQPWQVEAQRDANGEWHVTLRTSDE